MLIALLAITAIAYLIDLTASGYANSFYAAAVQAGAAVITALNEQVKIMEAKVSELFRRHPDAAVYLSQPGIGDITGARILGEYGEWRTVTAWVGSSTMSIAVRIAELKRSSKPQLSGTPSRRAVSSKAST